MIQKALESSSYGVCLPVGLFVCLSHFLHPCSCTSFSLAAFLLQGVSGELGQPSVVLGNPLSLTPFLQPWQGQTRPGTQQALQASEKSRGPRAMTWPPSLDGWERQRG